MAATTYTLDTTGEVIAWGFPGSANVPNRVQIVSAGTILVGQTGTDALFTVTSATAPDYEFDLVGGDTLFAKAAAGTVVVTVHETQEYRRPTALSGKEIALSAKGTGGSWYDAAAITTSTQQTLADRVHDNDRTKDATRGSDPDANDTNSPAFLPHTGEHYISPGDTAGNRVTTSAWTTTDPDLIDLRFDLVPEGIPAATSRVLDGTLIAQVTSAGVWQYAYRLATASYVTITFDAAETNEALDRKHVRILHDINGLTASIYYRKGIVPNSPPLDSDEEWVLWDTKVASAGPLAITAAQQLGGAASTYGRSYYRFWGKFDDEIKDCYPARDIDTSSDPDAGQVSWVSHTGETWTPTRSASGRLLAVVTRPVMVFDGTDDYAQLPEGMVPSSLEPAEGSFTVVVAYRVFSVPGTKSLWGAGTGSSQELYLGLLASGGLRAYLGDGSDLVAVQSPGTNNTDPGVLSVAAYVMTPTTVGVFSAQTGVLTTASRAVVAGSIALAPPRLFSLGNRVAVTPAGECVATLYYPNKALTAEELTAVSTYIKTGA